MLEIGHLILNDFSDDTIQCKNESNKKQRPWFCRLYSQSNVYINDVIK